MYIDVHIPKHDIYIQINIRIVKPRLMSFRAERSTRKHHSNLVSLHFPDDNHKVCCVYTLTPLIRGWKLASVLPVSLLLRWSVHLLRQEAWGWGQVCTRSSTAIWGSDFALFSLNLSFFIFEMEISGLDYADLRSCRYLLSTGLKSSIHWSTISETCVPHSTIRHSKRRDKGWIL